MHALVLLATVLSTLAVEPTSPTLSEHVTSHVLLSKHSTPPSLHLSDPLHLVGTEAAGVDSEDAAVGRVLLEGLGGFGLSLGGLMLYGLQTTNSRSTGLDAAIIPALILSLGSSAGVSITGSAMGRDGNFGFALLGSSLGLVLPLALGAGALAGGACNGAPLSDCDALWATVVGILVLPTVGGIIGFETSASGAHPPSSGRYPRRQLVPVLAPARQGVGATVGLAGTL